MSNIFDLVGDNKKEEAIKLAKKKGKDFLNKPDRNYNNWTVLHYCARYDHAELCAEFLKLGADTEKKDNKKNTPLHIAAKNNSKKVVEALVKGGANVNARDSNFQDAKTIAGKAGNKDIKTYLENPSKGMTYQTSLYDSENVDADDNNYNFGY